LLLTLLLPLLFGAPRATAANRCVLRIGTSGDYPPFSVAADGSYEGLDVEVVRRLGADLGCELRFVPFRWPELLPRLTAGEFDVVASGVTLRWERALAARYTRPYAFTGAVAVIPASTAAALASVADLNRPGLRIAVNGGGHLERVARAYFPRATLHTVADNQALQRALTAHLADAVVTDSAEVQTWRQEDIRLIGPFTHDAKALLVPAGDAPMAERLDAWLVAREADGWLPQLRARWLRAAPGLDATRVARSAAAALIQLRLTLMPSVAAAKRAAGLPITDAGQEARVYARVRALATHAPEHAVAVYGELIDMAKAVERHDSAGESAAKLIDLRDAISRVDEQLVRELERLPQSSPQQWLEALNDFVTVAGVDSSMRANLAQALAGQLPAPCE